MNTSKEDMLKIAGEVRDRIASGVSKNQACREAHIDKRTYDKYVLELESKTKQEIEVQSFTKQNLGTTLTPPVRAPVTFHEILIRLPIEDYNYLVEEKYKTGVAPATNAAKFVREKIREYRRKDSLALHINP